MGSVALDPQRPRSGLFVTAGYDPLRVPENNHRIELLNALKSGTEFWDSEAFDSFIFHTALEYLRVKKPRLLAILLGETGEWAHAGRYDLYLKSAHRVDQYARILWETLQSMPEYRLSTTLILATDHGRGSGKKDWRSHGRRIPDSQSVWMAFLGPDTPPLGVRENTPAVAQAQLAATIAALPGATQNSASASSHTRSISRGSAACTRGDRPMPHSTRSGSTPISHTSRGNFPASRACHSASPTPRSCSETGGASRASHSGSAILAS
ncbi:MAG: hypothetical protein KatS3mg005_2175 [Bryobacteraceae bacterium]|nr:MAG: hypothetical protein KatS3mg005_2175 [Bryobacteraceae bacterium]